MGEGIGMSLLLDCPISQAACYLNFVKHPNVSMYMKLFVEVTSSLQMPTEDLVDVDENRLERSCIRAFVACRSTF